MGVTGGSKTRHPRLTRLSPEGSRLPSEMPSAKVNLRISQVVEASSSFSLPNFKVRVDVTKSTKPLRSYDHAHVPHSVQARYETKGLGSLRGVRHCPRLCQGLPPEGVASRFQQSRFWTFRKLKQKFVGVPA